MPLRTWLMLSHLLVFTLPVVVLLGSGALARDLLEQTRQDLQHQAALLALVAEDLLVQARVATPGAGLESVGPALSERLRKAKATTLSGIEVTDTAGIVVATSGTVVGEDRSDHGEVQRALDGESLTVVKPRTPVRLPLDSPSRGASVRVFVAVPVTVDGEIVGAMVLSRTPREELETLYEMAPGPLVVGATSALLVTLVGGLAIGVVLTRSLRTVARTTTRIAEGRFDGLGELDPAEASHVADVALLATSVRATADRLKERLGYISEFASHVSHEFKTPLATLRGTVELLADDDGTMPADQRARFLGNAEAEVLRLQRLVDGLLGLARAEEARSRDEVDLDQLLALVVARHPGVALTGHAGSLRADRAQVEAVADNLLANAARYGAPPIEVVAFRAAGEAGFEVTDHGPGVSPANQARVFDRFFTTGRDEGGTGLGLALVRTVARAHGGDAVMRCEGGATRFRVTLAVAPTESGGLAAPGGPGT